MGVGKRCVGMRIMFITIALLVGSLAALGQGSLQWDYFGRSSFRNHDGETVGKGEMQRVKARVNVPFSVKKMEGTDIPRMWSVAMSVNQAWLSNSGQAAHVNPTSIINASLNVAYITPLTSRWIMAATAGAGIYAPNDYVRLSSVLFNGGAIFAYRLRDNLILGFGAGLTNSYGLPLVLPMAYFDWKSKGIVDISVNLSTSVSVKVGLSLGRGFGVEIVPVEFDGMSAVMDYEGKERLYSMMAVRSSLLGTYKITKKLSAFGGVGIVSVHKATLKQRQVGNFFTTADGNKFSFRGAPLFTVGLRYSLL